MSDKENGIQSSSKEIVINRIITEEDIKRFNEISPIIITLNNIYNQNPNIISKLNKNITVRILGGFNNENSSEFANDKYISRTSFSPEEASSIITSLDKITSEVNPKWSDLEKATYTYLYMIRNFPSKFNKEISKEDDVRPLMKLLGGQSDSVDYAIIYKELSEKLGIPCNYFQDSNGNAWNEILIDGEFYPLDLSLDVKENEDSIKNGEFELKNFLSDREFYYKKEHSLSNNDQSKKEFPSLEHSRIQESINEVLGYNKVIIPNIHFKSQEFRDAFHMDQLSSSEELTAVDSIKLNLTGSDNDSLIEDIQEIGKYYPHILDNVTLANATTSHIDMQRTIDSIYEARKNADGKLTTTTELSIESSIPEDFKLDLSNIPEVDQPEEKIEEVSYSQKISFINTSPNQVKLEALDKNISKNIDTILLSNFDVSGFNIKSDDSSSGHRRLELVGGNTSGIADLGGLSDVISLNINGINQTEFDELMRKAIDNSTEMPMLFDLTIGNQNLTGRNFFEEIKNPNIVDLDIYGSHLSKLDGFDTVKNQLISLGLYRNDLSIESLREISKYRIENPLFRFSIQRNSGLDNTINGLSGNIISDETFEYLDSYFNKSGLYNFRGLSYNNQSNIEDRKRAMLSGFSHWDIQETPYYIEDAEIFRKVLPYESNPMMIKDLSTFQLYLNDSTNYFEKDYLRDGTLLLTKEQITELINSGKNIPQKINIKINTVSELSNAELLGIKSDFDRLGLNFGGVTVFDDRSNDPLRPNEKVFDEMYTHLHPYSIDEFTKINDSFAEIIDGITPSMSDAEKFAVIYNRLAKKINIYDPSAHGDSLTKEHAIYQAKVFNTARNLSEGLIESEGFDIHTNSVDHTLANRSVCAGFADILKNALDLVGVESVIDSGNARRNMTTGEKFGGHEWNKIKIDGHWYYADLCWDNGKNTNYTWALRGSDYFVQSNNVRNINGESIEVNDHFTEVTPNSRFEVMEKSDFDQQQIKRLLDDAENGRIPYNPLINIQDDPDITFNPTIDIDNIRDSYIEKKNDMIAKFYGDREYQRRYEEASARYRENEIEASNGIITYKTVQDYPEKEEDEKFLLLDEYKDSLERMSKFESGDTSIYSGTPDQIKALYDKDKEYVETRNYTFDQHKNTQKDLATLGKYGETLPYIPKQTGLIKNGMRAIGNVGIFARNLVAPVYRAVGKYVAQPLHRLITGGKDASPYRNNPYHRFVARRDYFKDSLRQNDLASGKNHPIRNYIMSNVNAIARSREGNEKVLNAGQFDIRENLKNQEIQKMETTFYSAKRSEIEAQIVALENEILNNSRASNLSDAQVRLAQKKSLLNHVDSVLLSIEKTGKIGNIQTDAISQTQHDIASKEVNTYRVAAIKGVAKLGVKKFVGPKLKDWLLERSEKKVAYEEPYSYTRYTEKTVKDPSTTVPTMEQHADLDIEVDDLISRSKDKTVKLYRSVSGGNRGEVDYTMSGDEICSGLHFQDGTKWGTGFSNNAPLMTDNSWPSAFVDANNNLRTDITFSEIANAIANGEISESALDTLSLQVEGKGWVYASELFEGVTKEVQVGERIIEGATHTELVPEIVQRTRTLYKTVKDQRIIDALNTLEKIANVVSKIDTVHNVGEIVRPTGSTVKTNKNNHREYDYSDEEFYR